MESIKEIMEKNRVDGNKQDEDTDSQEESQAGGDDLYGLVFSEAFTDEQREQLVLALENGIGEEQIKERMLHGGLSAKKMEQIRRVLEAMN